MWEEDWDSCSFDLEKKSYGVEWESGRENPMFGMGPKYEKCSSFFFRTLFLSKDFVASNLGFWRLVEFSFSVVHHVFYDLLNVCFIQVTESASFQELGLDSLDAVELVMAIEEEFAVEIPDAEADKISSCSQAIEYITAHPCAK
jgi:acyl carrier protein